MGHFFKIITVAAILLGSGYIGFNHYDANLRHVGQDGVADIELLVAKDTRLQPFLDLALDDGRLTRTEHHNLHSFAQRLKLIDLLQFSRLAQEISGPTGQEIDASRYRYLISGIEATTLNPKPLYEALQNQGFISQDVWSHVAPDASLAIFLKTFFEIAEDGTASYELPENPGFRNQAAEKIDYLARHMMREPSLAIPFAAPVRQAVNENRAFNKTDLARMMAHSGRLSLIEITSGHFLAKETIRDTIYLANSLPLLDEEIGYHDYHRIHDYVSNRLPVEQYGVFYKKYLVDLHITKNERDVIYGASNFNRNIITSIIRGFDILWARIFKMI